MEDTYKHITEEIVRQVGYLPEIIRSSVISSLTQGLAEKPDDF